MTPTLDAFRCTSCGLCCRIELSDALPKEWDRGDGYCRHLQEDMRCGIYETRPLACRVDESWEKDRHEVFRQTGATTRVAFHALLYDGCAALQAEAARSLPDSPAREAP